MQYLYTKRYLKRFDRFPRQEQLLLLEADHQIRTYYSTRQAPHGLGLKLLHTAGSNKVLEARVSLSIRLLWAERGNQVSFLLVGSHDEVKRYLRSLR
ncbi:MAG: hypothetical protein HY352_04230 [Candidatus Omnitrophica bacterium]|nr:hypothetical protein [Candidatus Omnitrophota bacterium]